jgi:hypothetical protein
MADSITIQFNGDGTINVAVYRASGPSLHVHRAAVNEIQGVIPRAVLDALIDRMAAFLDAHETCARRLSPIVHAWTDAAGRRGTATADGDDGEEQHNSTHKGAGAC